jgi:hypothetical protein
MGRHRKSYQASQEIVSEGKAMAPLLSQEILPHRTVCPEHATRADAAHNDTVVFPVITLGATLLQAKVIFLSVGLE